MDAEEKADFLDWKGNMGRTTPEAKAMAAIRWNGANPATVIAPGSFIKKEFQCPTGCHSEHMWVKVTGEGTGLLWNQPATLRHLHHGQEVSWERREVQEHMRGDEVDE